MNKPIVVALDFNNAVETLQFVEQLSPDLCRLKVGKELFTSGGRELVKQLVKDGYDVFLDLKFHDIPNTVAKAVAASAELGVWMVNVHACGGERMMRAARSALEPYGKDAPLLTAVTVLTSMSPEELVSVGIQRPLSEQVMALAQMTRNAGLDGVVCSAHEARLLKQEFSSQFCLVTPGIRPAGEDTQDQKRVMTPQQAIQAGSDYLVMGRPIRLHAQPAVLLQELNRQLQAIRA